MGAFPDTPPGFWKYVVPPMKLKIVGKSWRVRFYTKKKYAKKYPGTLGVCLGYKRQIRLPTKPLRPETITHELVHAYFSELCFVDTDAVKRKELEEVYCELIANYGTVLLGQAAAIWAFYKRRRDADFRT